MFKDYIFQTFETKYFMDYKLLKIINEGTLLLVLISGKVHNMNVKDMKPCTTSELTEDIWN